MRYEDVIEKFNEMSLNSEDIIHLIDMWVIGKYAERNRQILKRKLIDGVCFEPLAEEFGLSVRQTKTIVYKSEEQLFKHIL